MKQEVFDLLAQRTRTLELLRPLSFGAQGDTSVVRVVDLGTNLKVAKFLRSRNPQDERSLHLVEIVRHIQSGAGHKWLEQVPGAPSIVFRTKNGALGCLSNLLDGPVLAEPGVYESIFSAGLQTRLRVAASLASQSELLHGKQLVWADVAGENLIYMQRSEAVCAIDVDGGGVLDSKHDYALHPIVRYRPDRMLMAPELITDSTAEPTLASDRWAVAVMVHRLLLGGVDPIGWARTRDEWVDGAATWPPSGPSATDTQIRQYGTMMTQLGADIFNLFAAVFRRVRGAWPTRRTSAASWRVALTAAANRLHTCVRCGTEVVAVRRSRCPFCNDPFPLARLTQPNGMVLALDRDVLIPVDGLAGILAQLRLWADRGQLLLDSNLPMLVNGELHRSGAFPVVLHSGVSQIRLFDNISWSSYVDVRVDKP